MIITNTMTEYDIQSAGMNILKYENLISDQKYNELLNYDKMTRVIKLGLLIKSNPNLQITINEKLSYYINEFIKLNNIKEYNINEIARDAIWIIGKSCRKVRLNKNIKFNPKRKYTITFIYRKNIKFYANSMTGEFLIRGINSDNERFKKVIQKVLLDYEYGNEKRVYNSLHRIMRNLKKDSKYYGDNLSKNIPNINIIKKLIKDLL